jgi:hypothetical protein
MRLSGWGFVHVVKNSFTGPSLFCPSQATLPRGRENGKENGPRLVTINRRGEPRPLS